MRLRHVLVLPALFVVTGLLAGGCDQGQAGMVEATAAYTGAHPPVKADSTPITPPPVTSAYPPASSGPGTPIVVPPTTQPDVVSFVHEVLGQAKDLAAKGKTNEAVMTVEGLQLQRSAWSRATRDLLDPQIAEVQKSLAPTPQPVNQ
jgi:hypothetical protein